MPGEVESKRVVEQVRFINSARVSNSPELGFLALSHGIFVSFSSDPNRLWHL